MLKGKSILITGGTGSFGSRLTETLLKQHDFARLVIFSRDEMKQWHMAQRLGPDTRLRFFIGDVRDQRRLSRALDNVDVVIHAAATKIVPVAEYNPFECIKTNVIGAMNVIDACLDRGVKKVVALSTDKASAPVNIYGASKLASDKLFIASNNYSGGHDTRFSVVRYGNVMGSRGSVIPLFFRQKDTGVLSITDKRMTRFMITLEQGVEFVLMALREMLGGEVFVKKIPSMNILDVADCIAPDARIKFTGIRAGEKIHEQMTGREDAPHTYEFDGYFKILPEIIEWSDRSRQIAGGRLVAPDFSYSSDTNPEKMTREELVQWVNRNKNLFVD